MPDLYGQLLEATIQHLRGLKSCGRRYVAATTETQKLLHRLGKPSLSSRVRPPAVAPSVPRVAAVPSPITQAPESQTSEAGISAAAPESPVTGSKAAALAELRDRVLACVQCGNLVKARHSVVFGIGNSDANLMFVGEAPGADEDLAGEPFVGKAGQLLTKIIQAMDLRREDVYIANILKCRPDTPGQSSGNRKPTPEEMRVCIPYLERQIDIIRPQVLVALGATAVEGLLGSPVGITRLRGQWRVYRNIPLMPTYHPAYLLRNQSLAEKRKVWEDMLQVMEKLQMPISAKQRNYFLRAA